MSASGQSARPDLAARTARTRSVAGTVPLLVAGLALAILVSCGSQLASCGSQGGDPAKERLRLAEHAATAISDRLASALARAQRAIEQLSRTAGGASAESGGADRGRATETRRRLDELERIRRETDVDGILTDDSSGDRLWAGSPVEPRELPAQKPWDGSFASGDVVFHAGPFLRAILVTGPGPRGGTVRVTVRLDDTTGSALDGTIESRWAVEHHVRSVRILPPASLGAPTEAFTLRIGVPRGASSPALAVEIAAPDEDVVRALDEGRAGREGGVRWLLGGASGLLALGLLVWRRVRDPSARLGALFAGSVLARHGLRLLDVPTRFPDWQPAFRDTDFGLPGFAGWFSTPGDLALSGAAILVAAVAIAAWLVRPTSAITPARRWIATVASACLAAVAVAAWLHLVEAASTQSRIDVFGPGSLLPSLPRALLLLGLCGATAAAFVLCRVALRRLEAACESLPRAAPRLLGAAIVALLAYALPGDAHAAWSYLLVPGTAAIAGRLRASDARPGAPSRILLTSVLSTVLLLPVLFEGAADARRGDVRAQVADWVRRESAIESVLDDSMSQLATDPHLAQALGDTRRNPGELAFYVWLALGFRDAEGALVLVRDGGGNRVSKFAMNTPPVRRLPYAAPPPRNDADAADDVVVETRAGVADQLRCVAGHLSVRGEGGALLGTVSVFVPDPLSVELAGAAPRIPVRPTPAGGADRERASRPLSLRLVANGRVVATNDLKAPSSPPETLPPIEQLSQARWLSPSADGGRPFVAVDAGARGVLVAEPLRAEGDEILFGVARVVIVGVGAGVIVAMVALAFALRRFRARLQDKILASYFVISVVPLVFLGYANWREASLRAEEEFGRRQEALVRAARDDFELVGADAIPRSDDGYEQIQSEAIALYRRGELDFTGLRDLVYSELLPERMPSSAFRAIEVEQRELHVEPSSVGGTEVRTAYVPMRGRDGTPFATVAVPVRFDSTTAERQASETGSVLLAAYLLTLVLVVVIGIYTARRLARPLRSLVEGTRRVAAGELGTAIEGAGRDEMGQLVEGFNSMTRDLAASRDLAARAERETAWRGMARQVAHEIKNPLTPMKLLLQQLAATSASDPAFAASMIEPTSKIVLEQIDALSRIASDFAAFARFPPRTLADCDVNAVLGSVIALYGTGETDHAEVRGELEEGLPPVHWDADELRRVFVNLVANAVQALDEAKGRVRVVVRSGRSKVPGSGRPAVLVTVTDDGVGIGAENRQRLFEPDFSTKTHGTGLGLAICRRILTDLSGEIRIDSEPGAGTVVSTWLPTREPPAPSA